VLKRVVIVFQISKHMKKDLDIITAKWVAKRCRPFEIIEMDPEHREWIHAISGGAYKGPSRETIMRYIAELATQICNGHCRYPLCLN
jgi:hypothetical protein